MALMVIGAFALGRARSLRLASAAELNSLPQFYGIITAMWAMVPGLALLSLWVVFEADLIEYLVLQHLPPDILDLPKAEQGLILSQVYNIAYDRHAGLAPDFMMNAAAAVVSLEAKSLWLRSTLIIVLMIVSAAITWFVIHPRLKAREYVENVFRWLLIACSGVAVLTALGIFVSVLFESLRFFQMVPLSEFLFGFDWNPQSSFYDEQVRSEGAFGALPLFFGTMAIAAIAMMIAVPIGLYAAIYLSEYAGSRFRAVVKPALEILAGVPTVVYGFFAALTVGPLVRDLAVLMHLDHFLPVSSESALAAGLVMGLMIVPFISSLADDVMRAVPRSLRDGSLALGATESETIKQVVIPSALPGIISGTLLAASRAIGETMIVVMAAGLAAKMTLNPLDSLTTVTVQMVTLLVGDQEFNSPKTLAAFALGLMLFLVTLSLNFCALHVVKRFRYANE
jgi:phosphate transport system permease protein